MKCDTHALRTSILQINSYLNDIKTKNINLSDNANLQELMSVVCEIEKYNNRVLTGIREYDKVVNRVCDYVKRVSV